ncbi:hypothetical protein MBRA_06289 [Methylobacterium brachiatum]|nr:hypothetical protein MBRA_06289 [Methylobacterium brachiatum]
METISIGTAEALTIFAPALSKAPITQIRLLAEGLKLDIERQFDGMPEKPDGFYDAVKANSSVIAKNLGIELIWISLDDFETTVPLKPEVVSGPADRLELLNQILLDALNYGFWSWWNGEEMYLEYDS